MTNLFLFIISILLVYIVFRGIYVFPADKNGMVKYRCNVITGKVEIKNNYERRSISIFGSDSEHGTYWQEVE